MIYCDRMKKPFSRYNDLTVVELKENLKSKKLPVSGTKKILIQRLEDNDISEKEVGKLNIKESKVKFRCYHCSVKLQIPKSYIGKIKCPECSYEREINGNEINDLKFYGNLDFSNISSFLISIAHKINYKIKDLDSKKVSLAISMSAVILMIIAIITFFSAFSYEAMCPDEYQSTVMIDGEEVLSCSGASWLETDSVGKLFNACCIFLPLSLTLAIVGYSYRTETDDKSSILDPTKNNQHKEFIQESQNTKKVDKNTLIDKTTKVIQLSILGFSFSLTVITIVVIILITIFFILAIYALLSGNGSFFA